MNSFVIKYIPIHDNCLKINSDRPKSSSKSKLARIKAGYGNLCFGDYSSFHVKPLFTRAILIAKFNCLKPVRIMIRQTGSG